MMPDDLETRQRRALWRAHHRGTKELDLLIGGYANQHLAGMDADQLTTFETLLVEQEPVLQRWLLAPVCAPDVSQNLMELVVTIRQFHGLDKSGEGGGPGSVGP